jgi:2-phospho-L-lactate/phosphoenolpyruvate guanylyltransferase
VRTAAILPVKRFALAKQRLGDAVVGALRADLARAMAGDVLVALHETPAIERLVVVTAEPSVAAAARYQGALVVEDTAEDGQSAAAAVGIERALDEGFERALLVPLDCPTLEPSELEELLAPLASEPEVVIVPDRHGTGTNALLLTPADAIAPSFGPGSCERHRRLALAAGARVRIERPRSLLLDVDTEEDLRALRQRLATDSPRGARTRAVIGRLAAPAA